MHAAPGNLSPPRPDAAAERRAALFRETPFEMLERIVLGSAWALQPKRLKDWPPFLRMRLADRSAPPRLPDPERSFGAAGYAGMVRASKEAQASG